MFTGIVETVGVLAATTLRGGVRHVAIASPLPAAELAPGQSVSVAGACLTVSAVEGQRFWAAVVPETLARTTLGKLRRGARLNLERALLATARLDGHLVTGHVDGVARVVAAPRRQGARGLAVQLPAGLERFVALKGSIALDGVSLTVSGLAGRRVEVALIPETLRRTTLGTLAPGDRLNVEVDQLARYLDRLLGDASRAPRRRRR